MSLYIFWMRKVSGKTLILVTLSKIVQLFLFVYSNDNSFNDVNRMIEEFLNRAYLKHINKEFSQWTYLIHNSSFISEVQYHTNLPVWTIIIHKQIIWAVVNLVYAIIQSLTSLVADSNQNKPPQIAKYILDFAINTPYCYKYNHVIYF